MSRPPSRLDIRHHFIAAGFTGRTPLEDGSLAFFENGLIHRAGGMPARELRGKFVMYYEHGMLHRDGGPAVVYADGREEYWHRGRPCHAESALPSQATAGQRNDTMPRLLASKPEI